MKRLIINSIFMTAIILIAKKYISILTSNYIVNLFLIVYAISSIIDIIYRNRINKINNLKVGELALFNKEKNIKDKNYDSAIVQISKIKKGILRDVFTCINIADGSLIYTTSNYLMNVNKSIFEIQTPIIQIPITPNRYYNNDSPSGDTVTLTRDILSLDYIEYIISIVEKMIDESLENHEEEKFKNLTEVLNALRLVKDDIISRG